MDREQAEVFARGLYHLASVDGIDEREVELIHGFLVESGHPELVSQLGTGSIHPMEELRADCSHGRLLVAVDEEDRAVGFALFDLFDDEAHLREIDVVPEHGGKGLGRRLIQAGIARAREAGLPRLVLTTFRDVPFNAPLLRPTRVQDRGRDKRLASPRSDSTRGAA